MFKILLAWFCSFIRVKQENGTLKILFSWTENFNGIDMQIGGVA